MPARSWKRRRALHALEQSATSPWTASAREKAALPPGAARSLGLPLGHRSRNRAISASSGTGPSCTARAAGADGGQQRVWIRAHHQERGGGGRSSRVLRRRVLGALVHRVGGGDDGDLAPPAQRANERCRASARTSSTRISFEGRPPDPGGDEPRASISVCGIRKETSGKVRALDPTAVRACSTGRAAGSAARSCCLRQMWRK